LTALLEVEDLHVQYPVPRGLVGTVSRSEKAVVRAVDGVSFSLQRGELLALVGESGCGKTTTAHATLRLQEVHSGQIRFDGTDITRLGPRELRPLRRRMQLIWQDPYESLDPRFRVRGIVEEPLQIHRHGGSKAERSDLVVKALERAGLTPAELYIDRFPHELSGGQRQRVAIASSLVLEPELLVADEPVSMLDVSVRAGILGLLDDLRRSGLGIVMITHDLSTAVHYADRIAVMYLGKIVEEGLAREVVANPRHPYTRALVSVVPRPDPRHAQRPQLLSGETPNAVRIPTGCRFHPRCPIAEPRCSREQPQLQATGPRQRAACLLLDRVDPTTARPPEPTTAGPGPNASG
jgi:oligopeptide/dipeptide ABC transporter ATP-binding protein